jgi:nitrite reductase/ring-hydroxylating ferredoxin subunit
MKRLFYLLLTLTCFGCGNNGVVDSCFPTIFVDQTLNLDLPQFINLKVPGGWSYANANQRGLAIFNLNGTQFKAYDRKCPEQDQSACSPMVVENSIILKCTCDDNEYNILNGSPLTSTGTCFAKEYLVQVISPTVIRITNF